MESENEIMKVMALKRCLYYLAWAVAFCGASLASLAVDWNKWSSVLACIAVLFAAWVLLQIPTSENHKDMSK